ncbi:hypothetical protein GCM10008921_24910 [Metaclostridioides mangenotii]
MHRQTPCEHKFTRTRNIQIAYRKNEQIIKYYDLYICNFCCYSYEIITNEKNIIIK